MKSSLQEYLESKGVGCRVLPRQEHRAQEQHWRRVFGGAFREDSRFREGDKALFEFEQLECDQYRVVPLLSAVEGLPLARQLGTRGPALKCQGPLVILSSFHDLEFFVSPRDFEWTLVHTHEDHGFGGPFFTRSEWVWDRPHDLLS